MKDLLMNNKLSFFLAKFDGGLRGATLALFAATKSVGLFARPQFIFVPYHQDKKAILHLA